MKTFSLVVILAAVIFSSASAQVSVEVTMAQEQFLPGESVPVAVKITNRSGQQLHLGADANWLTFSVESADGFVVIKNSEVPVLGEFDLESSQMATKRADIAPSFVISRTGRYKVTATLRIKEWSKETTSAPKNFDIITGAKLWAQEFGMPATNGLPEMRKFTLEQAAYLHAQMRMYVQLSDAQESRVFKTTVLGPTVSFNRPEAQIDRNSQLHVLWQSGAQSFNYCLISPDGEEVNREAYDDFNSRPRLTVNDRGDVLVVGGVHRLKPGEIRVPQPAVALPASPPSTNN